MLIKVDPVTKKKMCGEMRMFLDSLAPLQVERKGNSCGVLKVTRAPSISPSLTMELHSLHSRGQQSTAVIHCISRQEHDHALGVRPLPPNKRQC